MQSHSEVSLGWGPGKYVAATSTEDAGRWCRYSEEGVTRGKEKRQDGQELLSRETGLTTGLARICSSSSSSVVMPRERGDSPWV
jgi:hypothetical protein